MHRQLRICCKILGNYDKSEKNLGHLLTLRKYSRLVDNSIFFRHLSYNQSIQFSEVCRYILSNFCNKNLRLSENAIEKKVDELNLRMPLYLQNNICRELKYLRTNCYSDCILYVTRIGNGEERYSTLVRVTMSLEKQGIRKFKKLFKKLQKLEMLEFNDTIQNKKNWAIGHCRACAVFRIRAIASKILQLIGWDVNMK